MAHPRFRHSLGRRATCGQLPRPSQPPCHHCRVEDPHIIEGEAADDDPEELQGMARLAELRAMEADTAEL